MLPVVAGPDETRKQIVIYSALLVPLGLWPAFVGIAGGLYVLVSISLGAVFLAFALAVYSTREGREADYAARRLFTFSIFYLFGLFATLLVERGIDRFVD
jgi:protoheme IX farnesyltransferase